MITISKLPEVFQISGVKGGKFYISQGFLNKIDIIAIVILNIFLLTITVSLEVYNGNLRNLWNKEK